MENTEENLTASKEAGSVKISNDVISIIAALAIKDMEEKKKNTSKVCLYPTERRSPRLPPRCRKRSKRLLRI